MDRSLLLVLPAFLAAPLHAQLVTVNNLPNGSLITVTGSADEPVLMVQPLCRLNDGPMRPIGVRRYELDVQPGTRNYFCWGSCYPPVDAGIMIVWDCPSPMKMQPGMASSGLSAYHVPEGLPGISTYRYVWYDAADTHDTSWVDIAFDTSEGMGMATPENGVTNFSIHPNPSQGDAVRFTIDLANDVHADALVIRNSAGSVVRTLPIGTLTSGPATLTGLSSGVYLAAIESDGRMLANRRFMVAQ
jgi:hypothetical protein